MELRSKNQAGNINLGIQYQQWHLAMRLDEFTTKAGIKEEERQNRSPGHFSIEQLEREEENKLDLKECPVRTNKALKQENALP